jgi:NADPH:quinone reductase
MAVGFDHASREPAVHVIEVAETGGPEVLQLVEREVPTPGPGEIVVEVAAAGVNFVDTYRRTGLYPEKLPVVLGSEGAGTVIAVGDGARFAVGDRVAWGTGIGSYGSHALLPAERVVEVPEGLDIDLAAAVMLQGMTAHYLAWSTFPLEKQHTALVYAAAGGVGRLLVQLAKRRGARVIACTSTPEKAREVKRLGADEVVLYRDVDLPEVVRELTDGVGVDVAYDSVGRATFDSSLACLRARGTLVAYGNASGPVEPFDILRLARAGSVFATRPRLQDHTATRGELEWRAGAILDLVHTGGLEVHVHGRYLLADAGQAHRDLESGTTSGKLLLIP